MNSFKRNLIIGYAFSFLLLLVSSIASYISINNLLYSAEQVTHTNQVISNVERVMSELKDAETGQRGYLLTDDTRFLDPFHGALDRIRLIINQTRPLMRNNESQLADLDLLYVTAEKRVVYLDSLIGNKRKGQLITDTVLLVGKQLMDNARNLVQSMTDRERAILSERTSRLNRFTTITPLLIIIACAMGLVVTFFSFIRVLNDFNRRAALQLALQQKDEEISKRLSIVRGITEKISSGDYKVRVDDEGKDTLGVIANSVNKMAESLDHSFQSLTRREWLQKGLAGLNNKVIGKNNIEDLTDEILEFVTSYMQAPVGAFYISKDNNTLLLTASIALNKNVNRQLSFGEGIAGQAATSGRAVKLENFSETDMVINFTAGGIKPSSVIAVPIFFEGMLKGVLEIASLRDFSGEDEDFLNMTAYTIGMAINSVQDQQRLQELLTETQSQSEELQAQQVELETVNSELETQAEKLQASEEELKVQQEELQQVNQELEERSRLLEEKNELILERNLQIQAKAEELELTTKYKSEFLANMSHELRTPLNSILLLSRLLSEDKNGNLTADQVEYARVIQNSGNGLLTLIDEILDLSRIEAGKMSLEYTDVKIEEISSALQAMFFPLAKEKGIGFSVVISADAPRYLSTDRLRLEQILRNLISNSLKFTRQGSVKVTISKKGTGVAFSVKDTGIGIPKEKQDSIFEAFQQADGSTRRNYGGTGLGLSISRELARLLGGEITLQSELGKGSEFTLIVPAREGIQIIDRQPRKPLEEEMPVQKERSYSSDKKYLSEEIPLPVPDDRESMTGNDKSILIIEDDTAFARTLLDYTRQQGFKGIVAVRGDEGIALAKQFMPLGILLDIQLPVKSGWEVMDELKSDPLLRPIPVHIMSSHEVKTRSLSKGAVDFIDKPVAFEKLGEIFNKIQHALNNDSKMVLIVEENPKHAQALAYYLESYNIQTSITNSIDDGINFLSEKSAQCVILDMGIPEQRSYELLEEVKKRPGLESVPIIVFTGKSLSQAEEARIRQYADSIVIKTAHSYQRILDEVSLFLHLVEENKKDGSAVQHRKSGHLREVLTDKTILIVDDDVRNIFSLTKSLESHGMQVVSAIDGKEALKRLQQDHKIDLVLMDMMMPEMDGYEAIQWIRQQQEYKKLPVIAVTAKAMAGDREKCIRAGASDYITKPVDADQLISLLRVWLYR
ncbi:MAG TPA: response regulator [Chitinophagaceae bacterium]